MSVEKMGRHFIIISKLKDLLAQATATNDQEWQDYLKAEIKFHEEIIQDIEGEAVKG